MGGRLTELHWKSSLSKTFLCRTFFLHHVRCRVYLGQKASRGRWLWHQRQGDPVPKPGLWDSAGSMPILGKTLLRPDVPHRARISGLQRTGPQLIQDQRSHLEETHGKNRTTGKTSRPGIRIRFVWIFSSDGWVGRDGRDGRGSCGLMRCGRGDLLRGGRRWQSTWGCMENN